MSNKRGGSLPKQCLRFWMDNQNVKPYDLNKYTAVLASEFDFAEKLNSMATSKI
ncbi:MAG: hypothetical protein ACKPEO_14565 [Sphaerospermopsis kisseleviana]|uniref:hypothetical protein n=1 Tax=Sphaerospermopsis kisseleviana TaxID=289435 RepID=UPI0038F0DB39